MVNLSNTEFSGIMMVGVTNKKSIISASKVMGSVLNYTLSGQDITIDIFLNLNKRTLTIYSTSKPEGETITDLPKDGLFYPAIQNKTLKISNSARLCISYAFDLPFNEDLFS